MRVLRRPDERFARLTEYPFEPRDVEVDDGHGDSLRMHYVDEGAAAATVNRPGPRNDYTFAAHADWTWAAIEAIGLDAITLVCQDWGGLIGLRLVDEHPDRFARVVAANTFLPTG